MKHRTWFVLLAVSVVYTLVFYGAISPIRINGGIDSAIFESMGMAILQGKTPYIDLFDHKGILLYYINALGIFIAPPTLGLFLLSIFSLTITLKLWHKTACLFTNTKSAYIPVFAGLLYLVLYEEGGNLTENWCLPINSIILFLTARNLREKDFVSCTQGIWAGIAAGAVLFIRANNAYLIATCCIVSACHCLFHKRYKQFLAYSGSFLIGLGLSVSIILGFTYLLYGKECITGTVYGTFTFNFMYASKFGKHIEYGLLLLNIALLGVSAICLYLSRKYSNAYEKGVLIVGFVLFYLSCGKAGLQHYYISLAPLYAYVLSISYNQLHKQSILFIFIALFPSWGLKLALSMKNIALLIHYAENVRYIQNIPNQELDSIWNYNTRALVKTVLQRTGHTQCNRVFHHFQIDIDSTLKESIQESRPLWIALDPKGEWYAAEDSTYIKEHYEMKDYAVTHYKEKILFYRRKD